MFYRLKAWIAFNLEEVIIRVLAIAFMVVVFVVLYLLVALTDTDTDNSEHNEHIYNIVTTCVAELNDVNIDIAPQTMIDCIEEEGLTIQFDN